MNPATLEPVFGADMHPAASRALEEQHELFRIRADALLKNKRWVREADPETLAWAAKWASIKPLGRALSDGIPAPARVLGAA